MNRRGNGAISLGFSLFRLARQAGKWQLEAVTSAGIRFRGGAISFHARAKLGADARTRQQKFPSTLRGDSTNNPNAEIVLLKGILETNVRFQQADPTPGRRRVKCAKWRVSAIGHKKSSFGIITLAHSESDVNDVLAVINALNFKQPMSVRS
jgi:hypothetical protein